MGRQRNYLAIDIGSTSGRGMLCTFDGEKVSIEEIYRFKNQLFRKDNKLFWDVDHLIKSLIITIKKAVNACDNLSSMGIDTWGTDYGLLSEDGRLIGSCRCPRGIRKEAVKKCQEKISSWEIFERTGLIADEGNSINQIYERILDDDPALKKARCLLMMPDLLAYFLTGNQTEEYTIASTSTFLNVSTGMWDSVISEKTGISADLFAPIVQSGREILPVKPSICKSAGVEKLNFVKVASHDTASAVAAVTLGENEAFISSGTWMIAGMVTGDLVLTEDAWKAGFANEGTADGGFRLVKNNTGLWIINQCMDSWNSKGMGLTWNDLVHEAYGTEPFQSFIDVETPEFKEAGDMEERIKKFCAVTDQPVPHSVGEIARCVYESLAIAMACTIAKLEQVTGRKITSIRIVGGGSSNHLLNTFIANACGKKVYAGPTEATSLGNAFMQALALGDISDINEIRKATEDSFGTTIFEPEDTDSWQQAISKFRSIMEESVW